MEVNKCSQSSLSVGGFYGVKNKRKWLGIEQLLDNAVKRHREDRIPTAFKSRIFGPSTKWETFYRQQDAFNYARSTAKDLHVFAFESETLVGDSGQRMYLAVSYPVFWHYYRQLHEFKRHHYEIIPEGAVCKLYFDLEYDVSLNPGRNGNKMVDTLVKYVCSCLRKKFKVQADKEDILDLQASTDKKFSRHLVFLLKNAAFRDNIHAGKFVCHIMSQLLEYVRHDKESHSSTKNTAADERVKSSKEALNSSSQTKRTSVQEEVLHQNTYGDGHTELTNGKANRTEHGDPFKAQDSQHNISSCGGSNREKNTTDNEQESKNINENMFTDKVAVDKCETRDSLTKKSKSQESKMLKPDFTDILSEFAKEDLLSIIVQNRHGEDTLFCDTGVYTKNRNFRLFMSSKLGKKNPLTVSDQNQHHLDKAADYDEQLFYDSLVANVQYSEKMKILSYDNDSPESLRVGSSQRLSQERNTSATIEGYSKSPYPEVDDFISDLIMQTSACGVIRHWTYFQQGELLVYEIARYRFCHNIGREHRSNNIMYIADLRRGIYYQKCHDPDCQTQNFKSQDLALPRGVLPAHYFDELSDDLDLEIEDEDFLNTTAEMERQYFLNQSKDSGEDLSLALEDGDDEELMNALDEIESAQDD